MRALLPGRVGAVTTGVILLASALVVGPAGPARAATFAVNTTVDASGTCGPSCSLRQAVLAANASTGLDTITIPAGTHTLTLAGAGEDAAATGDLDVTDHLILQGAGAGSTIVTGNDLDRVFEVRPGIRVTIEDMTIERGAVAGGSGGGIFNNGGTLTVVQSMVRDNVADGGGNGGGIGALGGSTRVFESTVAQNEGSNGGGIFNRDGSLVVVNSTIAENGTTVGGYGGGGILNFTHLATATTALRHATVAENEADGDPGFQGRGDALADAFSPDGSISVTSSILASPEDGLGDDCFATGTAITMTSLGHNVASDGSCNLGAGGDLVADPLLDPLAPNGGPTPTMKPFTGSPALDAIASGTNGCGTSVTNDQRGVTRPQGASCDSGAVEVEVPACVKPPPRMRAWWTMDEPSGTVAADIAGVPNDGTHVNGPAPTAGVAGGALSFAGDDYVTAPDHAHLRFGKKRFTVDAWVRTTQDNGVAPIVDKRESSGNEVAGYALFLLNGKLAFQLGHGFGAPGGGFTNYVGPGAASFVADGQWHHVAATVNRSQPEVVLFVDGAPIHASTSVPSGNINDGGPLWIGRRHGVLIPSYANTYFKGDIDEVEIFHRTLSPSKVLALFEAGPAGKCKCVQPPLDLRAWWRLDETGGTISSDAAAFANDGTHVNAPTPDSGKVDGALRFDGTDDYVEVPHHAELLLGTGDLTIDAWIKTTATSGVQPIVDKRVQTPAGKAQGYALFVYHGRISIQLANGARVPLGYYNYIPPASNADSFVADGQWRHVAATVDRSSSSQAVKLYVDGAEVHSFTSYILPGDLDETAPLWIGRRRPVPDTGYANTYFAGRIDEVEIFARALQANEVKSIYKAPLGKCK